MRIEPFFLPIYGSSNSLMGVAIHHHEQFRAVLFGSRQHESHLKYSLKLRPSISHPEKANVSIKTKNQFFMCLTI
jgi:hypothetical protein